MGYDVQFPYPAVEVCAVSVVDGVELWEGDAAQH